MKTKSESKLNTIPASHRIGSEIWRQLLYGQRYKNVNDEEAGYRLWNIKNIELLKIIIKSLFTR